MLKNYIVIAVRGLMRNKLNSLINISGLSLGIACCLLLALYVEDEFSYDRHQRRLGDLYRIDTEYTSDRGTDKSGSISPPIAPAAAEEVPEIEVEARVLNPPGVAQSLVQYEDNVFYEADGFVADSTVFDILTYSFKEGNPKKALTDANTVAIGERLATKLFGDGPAMNKTILISQGGPPIQYKVTAVFRNQDKSFLNANFFTSMMSEGWGEYIRKDPEASKEWAGQNFVPSYVRLVPGHNKTAVEKKINDVLIRHGSENMKALGIHKRLLLEPLSTLYLRPETGKSQRITYLYVIVSIAAFILLIACINFMNLSTAKAAKRATEIGIRKVMGAFRASLVRQILGEAMVIVTVSILIGIVLAQVALPLFNQLAGKSISFGHENALYFGSALVILAVVTGFVAGSYPAFYLSSFQPAHVLKGKLSLKGSSGSLRQGLVVFQFLIAIVLMCGVIVISRQLTFVQEQDLGFNAQAKIVIPLRTQLARQHYESLKKEIEQNNAVQRVSGAAYVPGTPIWDDMMFYPSGGTMETAIDNSRNSVDFGFIELLDMKIIAGRSFSDNRDLESKNKVIINRLSAKKFGFEPDKIIGQQIFFDWQGRKSAFEVIGVMEDYNQSSLKDKIGPTLFEVSEHNDRYHFLIAAVSPKGFSATVAAVGQIWKRQISDTPFEYSFLDDDIRKQYDEDRKMSTIISSFAAIAIVICSLGLYGLSSFMAERRFKEIGVRKVMGASVAEIVMLMSREFVKLVLIAFLLATPIAWYAVNRWLQGFEYKVPVNPGIFLLAGLAALLVALLTISYESIRAASTNPVNSLRNE